MSRQKPRFDDLWSNEAKSAYTKCVNRLKTMSLSVQKLSNGYIQLPMTSFARSENEIRSDFVVPSDFSIPDISTKPYSVGLYRGNSSQPYKSLSVWTSLKRYQNIFIKKQNAYASHVNTDPLSWHEFVYSMLCNSGWHVIELPPIKSAHIISNPNTEQRRNRVVVIDKYNWENYETFEILPSNQHSGNSIMTSNNNQNNNHSNDNSNHKNDIQYQGTTKIQVWNYNSLLESMKLLTCSHVDTSIIQCNKIQLLGSPWIGAMSPFDLTPIAIDNNIQTQGHLHAVLVATALAANVKDAETNQIQYNKDILKLIMKMVSGSQHENNIGKTKSGRLNGVGSVLNSLLGAIDACEEKFEKEQNKSGSVISISAEIDVWEKLMILCEIECDKKHAQSIKHFQNATKNGNIISIYGPLYLAIDFHINRKVILLEWDVHKIQEKDLIAMQQADEDVSM